MAHGDACPGRLCEHSFECRRPQSRRSRDPAKDEAAGEQCKAYGAGGIMRLPGRLHITWQDDNTLRIDTDEGMQTRLLHFDGKPPEGGPRTWQGYSVAQWEKPVRGTGAPAPGLRPPLGMWWGLLADRWFLMSVGVGAVNSKGVASGGD